jgi:hypothetical protein
MITDYFRTGDDGDVFLSFNCSPDEVDPKPTALLFYSASIISIKYGRSMVNRKQHPAQPSHCNSETGKARRQLLCGSSSSRRFQTPYCQMLPYRGFGFVGQELSREFGQEKDSTGLKRGLCEKASSNCKLFGDRSELNSLYLDQR